jgi:uncharacterized membrane protein YcgQ (UPF0703/DUF1980 family)
MNIIDILKLIESILTIIALASGIIVAWLGLATWKKQIGGEAEHDLARRTLKVVYEFKETIFKVRTWGIFNDTSLNSQVVSESMSQFNAILPEVEALWEKATSESVDEIRSMGYQLLAALELERRERKEQTKSKKKIQKDKILIATFDNSDEFSQKLENKIQYLRSKLQSKLLISNNRVIKKKIKN